MDMTKKKAIFLWVTIPILIILTYLFINVYAKRSIQGRLRSAADDIGSQYSAGNTSQYEPYYLKTGYQGAGHVKKNRGRDSAVINLPAIRKLIKRAEVNLEVKDSEIVAERIHTIVEHYGGIIINSMIQKHANGARDGHTVLKIHPQDFDRGLRDLKELGKVERATVTGEDVTEEYVDLEARLANTQRVRERMLRILEERARKVEDILNVEYELARLGEQIERIQGRMKYLDRQVTLATITMNYHEPAVIAPHSFNIVKRFRETFKESVEIFLSVFSSIIVIIAALLPVLIWIGIIIGMIGMVSKVVRRRVS